VGRCARVFKLLFQLSLAVVACACTTARVPSNEAITVVDEEGGYRRLREQRALTASDSALMLSFSGGGTRAAALSYGVMQELRDTLIQEGGQEISALEAIDSISSVSGGSFTAAYYGAFGDRLFTDFEDDFLRQDIQSRLLERLLSPRYWLSDYGPGSDRTEMVVKYYDETIFRGATFNDINLDGGPFIEINATDLATGLRFSFSQERFDLLCSDLGSFPLARAVTASSAVPGVFPSVAIENHADQCDLSETQEWQLMSRIDQAAEGALQKSITETILSYRNAEERPFIHLIDGGISDNLGLRAMIDRYNLLSEHQFERLGDHMPRHVLIILVNAEVKRDRRIEQSANPPSISRTMATLTNIQMLRDNIETKEKLERVIAAFNQRAGEQGIDTRVYFIEVGFDTVHYPEVNKALNTMPTSLALEDEEVDRLIAVGRVLLRHDPAFSRYKRENGSRLSDSAPSSDSMCQLWGFPRCPDDIYR
jgi:NTE family protein